jgi:enoyl-CoA hydratase/carnithine racemase
MFTALTLERSDGVAVLTLDNPRKRNAMTPELTEEFPRAVEEIRHDAAVRAVILTNTGSTFCAGGDLGTLEAQLDWTPEENRRFMGDFYRSYLSILRVDVPTIAALNGHAIGAGLAMALGCDLRFASEQAKLGVTFLNLGLHPGMGTTHLLPQAVGYAHAADLIFTCRLVSAAEALQMGLVSRVLPPDQLLDAARDAAREIAARPTSGVRMAKRALVRRKLEGLESALDYEATAQMGSFSSPEMREAIAKLKAR